MTVRAIKAASPTDLGQSATLTGVLPPKTETLSYDADGNLIEDGLWTYTYNARNELTGMSTKLTSGTRYNLTFAYDYLGRRIRKSVTELSTSQTTVHRYLYDGWNLVADYLETGGAIGALQRSYVWGLDLTGSLTATGGVGALIELSVHNGSTVTDYFPSYDGNGNIAALVRSDGFLAAAYEYDPFGQSLRRETFDSSVADNPFGFSTKFTDRETGLVYYGLRYYSASMGRFINRDPIGEQGGMNLYGFVGNAPTNSYDLLGLLKMVCSEVEEGRPLPNGGYEVILTRKCQLVDDGGDRTARVPFDNHFGDRVIGGSIGTIEIGPDDIKLVGPMIPIAPNKTKWTPNKKDCDELRAKYPSASVKSDTPTGLLSAFTSATIAVGAATSQNRTEFSSIIYATDGGFAYTSPARVNGTPTMIGGRVYPSPVGGGMVVDNPPGTTAVAATHGHTVGWDTYRDWVNFRTNGAVIPTQAEYNSYGEYFSRADVSTARAMGTMGVATPSGSVLAYPYSTYGPLPAGANGGAGHPVPGAPQGEDSLKLQACINAGM